MTTEPTEQREWKKEKEICFNCEHTIRWHKNGGGCSQPTCSCNCFVESGCFYGMNLFDAYNQGQQKAQERAEKDKLPSVAFKEGQIKAREELLKEIDKPTTTVDEDNYRLRLKQLIQNQGEKLNKKKKEILREFVEFNCESCGKNEAEVGTLEIHRITQSGDYSLRNIKLVCKKCHSYFSSAQNIARGITS